jgi:ribose-phosphate pyrophosphokinase
VDRSAAAAEEAAAAASPTSRRALGFENDGDRVKSALETNIAGADAERPEEVPVSLLAQEVGLGVDASAGRAAAGPNGGGKMSKIGKMSFRVAGAGGLLERDRDVRSSALPGALQRLDKSNRYPVLFFAPEMKALAKKIAEEDVEGSAVELGDIDWRKFPDGFPDLFVNDAYGVRDRHVAFLASFHSPEVIFEQISIIYSLPKMFVASFTLILPFFPTGTSERVEREGEIATAVTLARILSNIPPSRGGPCSTLIFDIHALQERFYFGDNVLPCFESGIPLLLNRLALCPDADNIVIAYPDEGARKRFHGFFKGMEEVVCTKVRDGGKRLVKLKEGEPAGRHVVIVDDLVQSGGTLIECQKLLAKLGALKVSAYVTHGVFPGNSWERFTSSGAGGQGFSKFFLTDSCPQTAKAVEGIEPFEILSLSRPIAEALRA